MILFLLSDVVLMNLVGFVFYLMFEMHFTNKILLLLNIIIIIIINLTLNFGSSEFCFAHPSYCNLKAVKSGGKYCNSLLPSVGENPS